MLKRPEPGPEFFRHLAQRVASIAGSGKAFAIASIIVLLWIASGPLFGFSDTWQLVINTGTTIVTFLMVFLIQNTQNRDTRAMQLKLDELIRATDGAHLVLLDLEELSEEELERLRIKYEALAAQAREQLRHHEVDTGNPAIDLEDEG